MPTKDIAVQSEAGVPDLARTPASQITAEDIAIPTLYMTHKTGRIFDAELAKFGDIYEAQNADDPDPTVLYRPGTKDKGVLFLPLHMFKSWAYSPDPSSDLLTWPFDAQGLPFPDGPPLIDSDPRKRAYKVYNYLVLVPERSLQIPRKIRLYRTGANAAMKINGDIALAADAGAPAWSLSYRWTTDRRTKGSNSWTVPVLHTEQTTQEHAAAAANLYAALRPGLERQAQQAAPSAGPAI